MKMNLFFIFTYKYIYLIQNKNLIRTDYIIKVSDLSEFYEVGNFFNFLITFANHDAY